MKPCPCCGKEPTKVHQEFRGYSFYHSCEDFWIELHRFYPSETIAEEFWDKVISALEKEEIE